MMAINKDNLVIFQLAILTNPVRIENFHIRVPARCTFFGYALDAFSGGAPVLTHPGWPACPDIPGDPAATAADLDTDNNDTLFSFIPK
jgi:hypothetical protein